MADPVFISASAELAYATQPTYAQVAQWVADYAALKLADRLTSDGEKIDRKKANRQEDELNKAIKKALVQLGETELHVEGVGSVRLRDTDSVGYRLDAMSGQQIDKLTIAGVLSVKRTEVTEQLPGTQMRHYKPEWAWLKDYEVRGTGSTQLLFEPNEPNSKV